MLVNSQLVCLQPVGIFNHVMLFNICFIYTAPQASSFKHKPCINKVALPFYLYLFIMIDGVTTVLKTTQGPGGTAIVTAPI